LPTDLSYNPNAKHVRFGVESVSVQDAQQLTESWPVGATQA